MKLLVSIIIGILFLFSGARIKQLDATSQAWYGGRYEAGKGTDFTLTFKARGGSDKLIIDKLWVGDDLFEVTAYKDLSNKSDSSFSKKDTIYVRAGLKLEPDDNGRMIKVTGKSESPPMVVSGVALVGYIWKGKRKYLEINEFRKLEKIIYP